MGNNLVRVIESEREKGTVEMNLSQRGIMELPPEIGLLTNLKRLKLDGNQLTRIPFEINYLSNLQYLNLKSNSLKEFPEALCYMQRLEILDISKNQIKSLPEDFGRLEATLKAFSISKNRLQEIPTYFCRMKELKILKLDFNPIEYPPQNIVNCPPEMPQDVWLNRLKEFLKRDEKNGYPKLTDNENKTRHTKSLESHIREAASINDCDILCDTYFHNVPRLTHDTDKLDPWVYYFVESARNLIYAVAQLCRAIKQYSPATSNPKINELFEKEYGDVNRKVCQIIYSLDRFDRGISEVSLHRRLCSDLKLIVMTTIPDVKKLLISIQSNLKLLMESTNIRVSRNFLFTCHSVIVEVHAATESVLMAIPASERNFNPISASTPITRTSSAQSIPSLTNHRSSNSKSSMNSIINALNSKSGNTSTSSTVLNPATLTDSNDPNSTNPNPSTSINNNNMTMNTNINGNISNNNNINNINNMNNVMMKSSKSSSLNDLPMSIPISSTQNSISSGKNEPINITGTSLTESLTGMESSTMTESCTGSSFNESIKSFNLSQVSTENTNSSLSAASFAISKQQTIPENAIVNTSQLSQQLNIETKIKQRKGSIGSLNNEPTSALSNSTINGNKILGNEGNMLNINTNCSVTSSSMATPTPRNPGDTNNTNNGSLERCIHHKSSLSASSSTAIVGVGNEIFLNNELQQPSLQNNQNQNPQSINQLSMPPQTPSQASTTPLQNMNGMNLGSMGMNGIPLNTRNFDDNLSVYSASSLPSAMNMTVLTQPQVPTNSAVANRLNNLQNLSLTYELKEFSYPLEEQFFILSFSSLKASYSCLEILKKTFDYMKTSAPVIDNPDIYQLVLDCSGPLMENTKSIVDDYYEKFLKCVNYTTTNTTTNNNNTNTTNTTTTTTNNNNINSNNNDPTNESNLITPTATNINPNAFNNKLNDGLLLIPIKSVSLNTASVVNPKSTSEEHRLIYEDSIEYIHSLIQYTIIIREMTQRVTFSRNVIISLQSVTKSMKNLVKYCSK